MARKPEGLRPLTDAERSSRKRLRKAIQEAELKHAVQSAMEARTLREARQILAAAINPSPDNS